MLDKFTKIEIQDPVDVIISQIRRLIVNGDLKPGDKLPSERKLSDSFGIGRTSIRDAIKKLEFFGVLKALPQSGTIVNGTDITVLEGLFTNIINLSEKDFFHLAETRVVLEKESARLAALRATEQDVEKIWEAFDAYKHQIENNKLGTDEDFKFHLTIAEVSQNPVIKSLMMIIIPDLLKVYRKLNVCGEGRNHRALDEHLYVVNMIEKKDSEGAARMMGEHLNDVLEFSKKIKLSMNNVELIL